MKSKLAKYEHKICAKFAHFCFHCFLYARKQKCTRFWTRKISNECKLSCMDRDIMIPRIFYLFYNVKNKEKEDQNVSEKNQNKYLRYSLDKEDKVRREIHNYSLFLFA